MVEAITNLLACYDDGIAAVTAGMTRCIPQHQLVERFPLAFVADDFADRQAHTEAIVRYLEREGR